MKDLSLLGASNQDKCIHEEILNWKLFAPSVISESMPSYQYIMVFDRTAGIGYLDCLGLPLTQFSCSQFIVL